MSFNRSQLRVRVFFLTLALLSLAMARTGIAADPIRRIAPKNSNSMSGKLDERPDPPEIITWRYLDAHTKLMGHPIETLQVLNNYQGTDHRDDPLPQYFQDNKEKIDAVANGTFFEYDEENKISIPVGSTVRNEGKWFYKDPSGGKSRYRGGVAVLSDGRVILGTAQGEDAGQIDSRFGTENEPVFQFMGGGALLINNRFSVSSDDLRDKQSFTQGSGGFGAGQFRKTHHCVIAIHKSQAYLLVNKVEMTGKQLQAELSKHGFETAVKFDGGSKCYYDDGNLSGFTIKSGAVTPTGFAITTPTFHIIAYQAEMKIRPPAQNKPISQLQFSDVEFTTGPKPALMSVKATSLQYDKTKQEGQADWLVPGQKIAVPVKAQGRGPDGKPFNLLLPMMLEVAHVSRDRDVLLEKYPELRKRMSEANLQPFWKLLEIEKSDGTASMQQEGATATAGPFEKNWTMQRQREFFEFAKAFPQILDCFVATAVYRTDENESITRLRLFRDRVLAESPSGRRLIDAYYHYGPILAAEVRRHPGFSEKLRPAFDLLSEGLSRVDWENPYHRVQLMPLLVAADLAVQKIGPEFSQARAVEQFDPFETPSLWIDLGHATSE